MIVHTPNLKNKIGVGSVLILSLRNSGENPKRESLQRLKIICVLWNQISEKLECKVICEALHDVICKINKFIQMIVDNIKHQFNIQVLVFMH